MKIDLLCEQEVENVLAEALDYLSVHKESYPINFSQRIIFGGLCDETTTPVKLVYSREKDLYVLFFSSHYLNNKADKIKKLIIRYILCTNNDGTFKTYNEMTKAMRKVTDGNHYESTYMADWLKSDIPHEHHIFCKKCNRTFYYDKDHDIFQHPQNYKCDCGGQLMVYGIEDCVDIEKKQLYFEAKCVDGKSQPIHDREFFAGLTVEDKDMRSFIDFEKNNDKITRVQLADELKRVIDNKQYNLLSMYNRAYPKIYATANRYMPFTYQQAINSLSPVNYVETVKTRKRVKPKLDRAQYVCDDSTFVRVSDYFTKNHTIRAMKKLVMEAVKENNLPLYMALQQADKTQFDKSFNYMTKTDKELWKVFNDGNLMQGKQ